jgi:hypothetical protein
MMNLQKITWIAAILSAGVMAPALAQGWDTEAVEHLQTAQGPLQIDQVGAGGYRLFVAGHFIAELEAFSIDISSALPSTSPQYVLLEMNTGGGSCPHLYRLLDLTPGRKPYLSGEFGNCSAAPAFDMRGDNVRIDFPNFRHFKAQTFFYDPKRRRISPDF